MINGGSVSVVEAIANRSNYRGLLLSGAVVSDPEENTAGIITSQHRQDVVDAANGEENQVSPSGIDKRTQDGILVEREVRPSLPRYEPCLA